MELILLQIVIVFLFVLSIFLDDLTICKFFDEIKNKNLKSEAFTERSKRTFFLRCINHAVPVFCGYFITFHQNFFILILICFNLSILSSLIYFNYKYNLKFLGFKLYFEKIFFLGTFTFILYLNAPLLINFLSIIFETYSKIILQLTTILNFFPVVFVTFFIDPLISQKIDKNKNVDNIKVMYISIRLFSRLILALIFNLIYFIK